jgi:hypothetical protein
MDERQTESLLTVLSEISEALTLIVDHLESINQSLSVGGGPNTTVVEQLVNIADSLREKER